MSPECAGLDAAIAALGTPALRREDEARVRAHLAVCAPCSEVASLLRSAEEDPEVMERTASTTRAMKAGTIIAGRYRLERLLGRGGMGVVWAATQEPTGQQVAVKLLHSELADGRTRRRILREARAACAVRHPNVVRVHDVIETEDGAPALVMESLEGHTLQRRFDRGPSKLGELCSILGAVAAGVAAAHEASIVHRDLKPDNVFIARYGSATEVKVLDFGVAKLGGPGLAPAATLTRTGAMVGTPFYMAPEQILGEADVDGRADVWALGLMLYQGITGVLPTRGDNLGQVIKAVTITPFPSVANIAKGLPPDLAALIDRMLTKDRDGRPRDVLAIRAVLARHADASIDPAPELDEANLMESELHDATVFPRSDAGPGHEHVLEKKEGLRPPADRNGAALAAVVAVLAVLAVSGFALRALRSNRDAVQPASESMVGELDRRPRLPNPAREQGDRDGRRGALDPNFRSPLETSAAPALAQVASTTAERPLASALSAPSEPTPASVQLGPIASSGTAASAASPRARTRLVAPTVNASAAPVAPGKETGPSAIGVEREF